MKSRRQVLLGSAAAALLGPKGHAFGQQGDQASSQAARPGAPASAPTGLGPLAAAPATPRARIEPRPLVFPADFGSHPTHRTEWWYLTGWVETVGASPRLYGFQVTFFRSRTDVAGSASRFSPGQLVFAHVALSDIAGNRQRHDQRIARLGFGVHASETDTDVAIRDWSLVREGPPEQSRYRTRVASDAGRFAFDFALATRQPTLLQGEAGYSRKGPLEGQASHYYSHPQLALEGQLTVEGQRLSVKGLGWVDHEWSDDFLASEAVGWDWTGMNLDDGSALTAFQLRRADGTATYAGGSFRPAGGATRNFAPDEVKLMPGRPWKSPASNAVYPVEWTLVTPVGTFAIASLIDAQEQDSRASTGAFYWEGLSELRSGEGPGRRVGRGYLEMTGYVQRLQL